MFDNLIKQIPLSNIGTAFVTDSRVVGVGFECNLLDTELSSHTTLNDNCINFVESMPLDTTIRFLSKCEVEHIQDEARGVRAKDLELIGNINFSLKVFIEKKMMGLKTFKSQSALESHILEIQDIFSPSVFERLGLRCSPIENYEDFFNRITVARSAKCGLLLNSSFFGILKLRRLSTHPIDINDLIYAREALPVPHTVSVTVKKLSEAQTQIYLKRRSKQESSGNDLTSYKKFEDAQESIAEADLNGRKYVEFEMHVIFEGDDEQEILKKLYEARAQLKSVGEFDVEIVGAFNSMRAALLAGGFHHTNVELDYKIQPYLPIYARGNNVIEGSSKRSFTFHRANDTLTSFDPYSRDSINYSGIIIGQSGRGKSVFNNMLLKSLLADEKCKVILVDVMGSYKRFTERFEGSVHRINSTDPSGISPFEFLKTRKDKASIEIVLDFIEKLLLEDDETALKKSEQVELEKEFMTYMESSPQSPSIDGFLAFSNSIPRKINLERWRSKGLFGNIFYPIAENRKSNLQYFDFTEISGAANGGVSKAVMSAIMAHFSFLLLSKQSDEKLVFMCDETPFFVKNCFSSFTLLSKNVRKLGGSLILTSQMLSDLIVNGDASLIAQSEFKIFFSSDGSDEFFLNHSGLSVTTLETLKSLRPKTGDYSIFFLKDNKGERLCKLILSKEEYYTATTYADDKNLIKKIKESFDLDSEEKAAQIVSTLKEADLL